MLGRWAAGASGGDKSPEQAIEEARRETSAMHRDSVLWYLGKKLEGVGEVQRGMMERRLEREVERGRSVLYKVKGNVGAGDGSYGVGMSGGGGGGGEGMNGRAGEGKSAFRGGGGLGEDESRRDIEQQLSPEQLQLFAQENQDMLKQYEDTLDQVRSVHALLQCYTILTQRHCTEQLNVPCSKYPSCKPAWFRISTYKLPTSPNWSLTRYLQQTTLAVGIKSLKGQPRERVLLEWYSGLVVDCVAFW